MKPTDEQTAIIEAGRTGDGIVVEALAGSGKTSTLRLLAESMPRRRGLYLAYNRAIKDDAVASFPRSVKCMTSHGLAYGPVATRYRHRLGGGRMPAQQVAQVLGIREPIRLAADMAPLAPQQLARMAIKAVGQFCKSADLEISAQHLPDVSLLGATIQAELSRALLPYARKAWTDIQDPAGRLPFTHDHYLKIYQIARPTLRWDYVMVDEAQDLNPCVAALIADQTHLQVVYVGDQHQAINGWNGAVDALSGAPGKRLYLTQSFRFGAAIAAEANKWLSILRAPMRVRGLESIASRVERCEQPAAILARSNATALERVMSATKDGRKVALVGDGKDLRALALAAQDLTAGRGTDHPDLLAFASWTAVQEYVQRDESGSDLRVLVDLIDTYTAPVVVATVDRLWPEEHADVVVSTAHKSKGRQWTSVQVAGDFREPIPDRLGLPGVVEREDAMLAYVTVTRAQHILDRGGLSWVDAYVPGGVRPRDDQDDVNATAREILTLAGVVGPEGLSVTADPCPRCGYLPGLDGRCVDCEPVDEQPSPSTHCRRCGRDQCHCGPAELHRWQAFAACRTAEDVAAACAAYLVEAGRGV